MSRAGDPPGQILARLESTGIRLGLARIRALLYQFGDPQKTLPAVLVAGTNGKGTTSANLAAMLSAAGFTTGLYSSPHLEFVEERIRVDGLTIESHELSRLLREVVDAAVEAGFEPPTYFEAMTTAAILHFSRTPVEVAVFEVGLGGRLDATNVLNPILSVITEIGLDHQNVLGDSLDTIAREKAGILRPGTACCYWVSNALARREIETRAEALGSPLFDARLATAIETINHHDGEPEKIRVQGLKIVAEFPTDGGGEHRERNLALVLVALEVLARSWPDEDGFVVDPWRVELAVASCLWPGRCEWIRRPDGGWVLLDGAHNLQGAKALAKLLAGRTYGLVFGALIDKEPEKMIDALAEGAEWTIVTQPPNQRSQDPHVLASTIAAAQVHRQPTDALGVALGRAHSECVVVVCGSLYLVGAVRSRLRELWGRPDSVERIYQPFLPNRPDEPKGAQDP